MLKKLQPRLEEDGFTYLGHESESTHESPATIHKDWTIHLVWHQGSLLAVDIIHHPSGFWFGRPTYEEWGNEQAGEVLTFTKSTIDRVGTDWMVEEAVTVPGQMELFVESDRNV